MTVTSSEVPLLQIIERFNRKERYILFQQVTSPQDVELDDEFRQKLNALGWGVPKQGVLVLTDYHLNWLYAALELHRGTWTDGVGVGKRMDGGVDSDKTLGEADKPRYAIEGNQEDIDLLLVWEDGDTTHLGLVEAKAHSGWTNQQLRSKAARLSAVLGRDECRYPGVQLHFALLSFTMPSRLATENWPKWMLNKDGAMSHVQLEPPQTDRYIVGRVDAVGKPSAAGEYYGIRVAMKGSSSD